ncbi:MAG: phosphate transporter permease [Mucilaginibacter sp.]|uniref:ABC transporter permease n=1 Tax=Mucilaginibacter sp. TaxID=1882438 RepID=UPI00262B3A5F|nr:ABC transporter permease [Mucilaginibacter sp.]MDB5001946.1 phosphate transporter permease [Mucilaginibacter sp.]
MDYKQHQIIIEPGRTEKNYWKDLWRFRELFYILSWRDVKVKYKQTALGVIWSILRPLLVMVIFTVVFNRFAKLPANINAPYALFVFAGMLPWTFFSSALTECSNSLVANTNLITKVYFPRLIVPASAVIASFVDFLISLVLLFVLFIYYQFLPPIQILLLPIFLFLSFLTSFSIGLYLTALNVKYRDFRYIIPFIVQFGLYVSPVGYSSSIVPHKWRLLFDINPVVGIIDGFRWCILGGNLTSDIELSMGISVGLSLFMLIIAIRHFRKTEKTFADII